MDLTRDDFPPADGSDPGDFEVVLLAAPRAGIAYSARERLDTFAGRCLARRETWPPGHWPPGPNADPRAKPPGQWRPRFRVAREETAVRLGIDIDLVDELGPVVAALARESELDLWLPVLDAVVPSADAETGRLDVWQAVALAEAEFMSAVERGRKVRLDALKYVRVEEVGDRRVARSNVPTGKGGRAKRGGASKYDDWDWHVGGEFPAGRPPSQGFVHIGMYLTWLIHRGLVNPTLLDSTAVEAVRKRARLGTALREEVDGKLSSSMLNEEGEAFSDFYYAERDTLYFSDLVATFGD